MLTATPRSREQIPRVAVLVSCYNEAGRVVPVIEATHKALPLASIIVIDDGSTDASHREAISAGVTVLRHACNLGAGAASETGYLYALRNKYDVVLQLDGDGQHPADRLPDLLQTLIAREADIVIGSRYLRPGDSDGTPVLRWIGHRVFSTIVRLVGGIRVTDPTSGFRALSRKALLLFSDGVFPCDYPDSDVILMSHMSGLRIHEIPVRMKERVGGTSMHAGIRPLYYGFKMLLSMFMVILNFRRWGRWRQSAVHRQLLAHGG